MKNYEILYIQNKLGDKLSINDIDNLDYFNINIDYPKFKIGINYKDTLALIDMKLNLGYEDFENLFSQIIYDAYEIISDEDKEIVYLKLKNSNKVYNLVNVYLKDSDFEIIKIDSSNKSIINEIEIELDNYLFYELINVCTQLIINIGLSLDELYNKYGKYFKIETDFGTESELVIKFLDEEIYVYLD